MNERIKELAVQADLLIKKTNGDEFRYGNFDPRFQKFAELIVKECYEHCKGQMLDKEVADTNELTYNDAVMDCSNGLLQHFGIEE